MSLAIDLDTNDKVAPDEHTCAKWLVYESEFDLTNLEFRVHSANPSGSVAEKIRGPLTNFIKHLRLERSNPPADSI